MNVRDEAILLRVQELLEAGFRDIRVTTETIRPGAQPVFFDQEPDGYGEFLRTTVTPVA